MCSLGSPHRWDFLIRSKVEGSGENWCGEVFRDQVRRKKSDQHVFSVHSSSIVFDNKVDYLIYYKRRVVEKEGREYNTGTPLEKER